MAAKARILIVDDHPDSLEVLSLFLRKLDFEVVSIDTGERALCLAKELTFDAYVLDSWLPDISGPDLCQAIREFDSHTPVVFYSANAATSDIEEALKQGAQGYIVKPATLDEVIEVLSTVIDQKRTTLASST